MLWRPAPSHVTFALRPLPAVHADDVLHEIRYIETKACGRQEAMRHQRFVPGDEYCDVTKRSLARRLSAPGGVA
jgi:hypothetical protein